MVVEKQIIVGNWNDYNSVRQLFGLCNCNECTIL